MLCFLSYLYILDAILSIASIVFDLLPNAVNLKYPSPLGPNPTPGVPTIANSFNNLSKKSHYFTFSGNFNHIYGAFIPPYTVYPAFCNPSLIILAFS